MGVTQQRISFPEPKSPLRDRTRKMNGRAPLRSGLQADAYVGVSLAAWLGVSYGWPWVFLRTGVIGILWCVVWYIGFDENPKAHPKKSSASGQTSARVF